MVIKIKKENQKPKKEPKQNLKGDKDFETKLKWFIDMFNNLSNITPVLRVRLKQQLANGFTGAQMRKAVINLYSSSMDNKFHKESRFKSATPEYLLKDDNLNKYSNINY